MEVMVMEKSMKKGRNEPKNLAWARP